MSAVRAAWSSTSFLLYAGGLTLLIAVIWLLATLSDDHEGLGFVGWSALVFVIVAVGAVAARRAGQSIVAGLLALSAVVTLTVFVGAVEDWFGWLDDFDDSAFEGFRPGVLLLELVAVAVSFVALSIFRFPLLVLLAAAATWFFVVDLISGGGNWSAFVSLGVGLIMLLIALGLDADPETRPYAFWLHVAAALAIGGALLWFFHDGELDWILIGVAGLAYVFLGDRLQRSSWVVLGAWGMLQTATHFAGKWSYVDPFAFYFFLPFFLFFPGLADEDPFAEVERGHEWLAPLIFAGYALVLIAIALFLVRRRRALPAP